MSKRSALHGFSRTRSHPVSLLPKEPGSPAASASFWGDFVLSLGVPKAVNSLMTLLSAF